MKTGAKCQACVFYDLDRQICTRDGSGWSGEHRERTDPACAGFRGSSLARQERRPVLDPQTAEALAANVQQMGKYLTQMGQLMGAMQKRMEYLEARQAALTISHAEVKKLQARIRARADAWCRRYELTDTESAKKARAAIKKELLRTYQVRDLHDLPAVMLSTAEEQIDNWTDIRLVMELRKAART